MSSADGLAAMRYSGSSRASFCFAGSSEGNGLSVMAMTVRGMNYSWKHVMPGLDPGIHMALRLALPQHGLPGQARQ
jgi:hypothetical protein